MLTQKETLNNFEKYFLIDDRFNEHLYFRLLLKNEDHIDDDIKKHSKAPGWAAAHPGAGGVFFGRHTPTPKAMVHASAPQLHTPLGLAGASDARVRFKPAEFDPNPATTPPNIPASISEAG